MTDNVIHWPTGFSIEDLVSWGNTGMVCLDAASNTVVKFPHSGSDYCRANVEVERRVYERFQQNGGHGGLLQYYGPYESCIRLEYAPKWELSSFLRKHPEIETRQRLRWARQVADALCFIHASNVIHGDLTTNNILVTDILDVKVADFGGSSIDGSSLNVVVNASHQYPGPDSALLSVRADLFALGSVLYTMTGSFPYQDLLAERKVDEIEALLTAGNFLKQIPSGPSERLSQDAGMPNTTARATSAMM